MERNQDNLEYSDSESEDEISKVKDESIVVIVFGIIAFTSFLCTLIYAFRNREEESTKKTQNSIGIFITLLYILVWFFVIGVLASHSKYRNDVSNTADALYGWSSFVCTGDAQIDCDYIFALNRWFNALLSLAILYPISALVFSILVCHYHRPHVLKVSVINMVQQPQLLITGVGNAFNPSNPQFQYSQNPNQPPYNNQILQGQPVYGTTPNNYTQNMSQMPMNSNQNQNFI